MADLVFSAIGTRWLIRTVADIADPLKAEVFDLIADFDAVWSRFRDDSMVSELARAASSSYELSPVAAIDAAAMLACYNELSDASAGRVNPLLGGTLSALGYDRDFELIDQSKAQFSISVPDATLWSEQLSLSGSTISLSTGALIDVGAIGKGRLVDRVFDLLAAHLSGPILVDAGADQRFRDYSSRVGLEHPFNTKRAVGVVVTAAEGAIAASASNRRRWGGGKYHHIIDGLTGWPVTEFVATWVGASSAMRADALATALFFPGGAELAANWAQQESIWWLRMSSAGALEWSSSFERLPGAELFVAAWQKQQGNTDA